MSKLLPLQNTTDLTVLKQGKREGYRSGKNYLSIAFSKTKKKTKKTVPNYLGANPLRRSSQRLNLGELESVKFDSDSLFAI